MVLLFVKRVSVNKRDSASVYPAFSILLVS